MPDAITEPRTTAVPPRLVLKQQGGIRRAALSVAIVVVVTVAVGGVLFSGAISWPTVWRYLFAPPVLSGLWVTIQLTVLAMVLGVALGIASALMLRSRTPAVAWLARAYIWFFRGTPVLVQLIFWFNLSLILPTIGWGDGAISTNALITPFIAALLGLGINEGAYMSEIFRAGIDSVDRGQTEAGLASGMTPAQVMRRIVLPQALMVITPPTGNQAIGMLKTTSLVSVIAAQDLLTSVQRIYATNYQIIDLLIVACIWYLLLTTIATIGQSRLERSFTSGQRAAVGTRRWRRSRVELPTIPFGKDLS
ncbi:amino acid ABC transporter permease [Microbacterium sp. 18062]|uniref:amino acid ABC transporter permease n=1 Tax=Microbacterium sp. 18062 TaxID=2681410 RepID=UPI00135AF8C9|nr:amino acid ABC transporter permease [Microbacterium sp. 18062]